MWLAGVLFTVTLLAGCSLSQTTVTVQGASPTATTSGTAHSTPPAPTPTPTSHLIICPSCVVLPPSIHEALKQQTLSGTAVGPVTATCPSGEVALSGGWATSPSGGTGVHVYNSSRSGTDGWNIFAYHVGATLVNAYVECLANASGATIIQRSASQAFANYGASWDGAYPSTSCNAGEKMVGSGFAIDPRESLVSSQPYGSSTWQLSVYGPTSFAGTSATLLVECLTYSAAHISFTPSPNSGGLVSVTAACPSGATASGGGFVLDPNAANSSLIPTMHATSSGWQVYITPASTSMNAYAACVAFS